MEAKDGYSAPAVAAALRSRPPVVMLDGRLTVTRWDLNLSARSTFDAALKLVARSYVAPNSAWLGPTRPVGPRLPAPGTVRKGDFGEILAGVLYSTRLGRTVPFTRLETKPDGDATVQGPDVLALTLDHGEQPVPTVVEVKLREVLSPKQNLTELGHSATAISEERLAKAWAVGLQLMEAHPNYKKSYALSAAEHLAALDPNRRGPVHCRHGVLVSDKGRISHEQVKEYWGEAPPVSELHLLTVPDLVTVMDDIYATAGELTYSDIVSGAPEGLSPRTHTPGTVAPISSVDAKAAVDAGRAEGTLGIVEASLWLLADWDGMGVARAREVLNNSEDPTVKGLAQLLTGALAAARRTLADAAPLDRFAELVQAAWMLDATAEEVLETAPALQHDLLPGLAEATRYVAAATAHRLHRHAGRLVAQAGAGGPRTTHLVADWAKHGRHALWPSQAAALAGGLLDPSHAALVVKMPTSAGKTALLQLLVADTLDRLPNAVVVVLAKTKALVSQLARDLGSTMPEDVEVRSSFGGLDFDTLVPNASIVDQPGAAVLTPERFDLEWRRAVVDDDGPDLDAIELLVVDEAHLLFEHGRGARLEMILSRAMRRNIRVIMLSSQFPDPAALATWLGGQAIVSDWSPTWLERFVYYPDGDRGLLQAEVGEASAALTLTPQDSRKPGMAKKSDRRDMAAALIQSRCSDGLVVVFSDHRSRVSKLVEAVERRLTDDGWLPHVELLQVANGLEASAPRHATLLRSGIGVHHAMVPRPVKEATEVLARQGRLRCVICTPTLLEGVDFPANTVLAVYPPWDRGRIQVGRLHNLAGRAGRSDRATRGTLIVMTAGADKAHKWLRSFRAELPPTVSALTDALNHVRAFLVSDLEVLSPEGDEREIVATLDTLLLAAGVEGGVVDGDWRAALEAILGRTLWAVGASESARSRVLQRAAERAEVVTRFVGTGWDRTIYRTGLPLAAALRLRAALEPRVNDLASALRDTSSDHTSWLLALAVEVAPRSGLSKLPRWGDHSPKLLTTILQSWLDGEPEDQIAAMHPDTWEVVANELDTILPWVLTAAIDFAATASGQPDLRNLGHQRLGIARLRYGVSHTDLCALVRDGLDRTMVAAARAEWLKMNIEDRGLLVDYVIDRVPKLQAGADATAATAAANR